jgi:hypothetical protein
MAITGILHILKMNFNRLQSSGAANYPYANPFKKTGCGFFPFCSVPVICYCEWQLYEQRV